MTDSNESATQGQPVAAAAPPPVAQPAALPAAPAPAPVNIDAIRLSFVWAEVFPPLLQAKLSGNPWTALARADTYRNTFNQAQKDAALKLSCAEPARLLPPWRLGQEQRFWMRYLVQGQLAAVTGKQAWKNLVPLRGPAPYTLRPCPPFYGKAAVQPFYYSFGSALTITFECNTNLSLQALVDAAFALHKTEKLGTSAPAGSLDLNDFAALTLKFMREQCLGPNAPAGRLSQEPFTVFTITKATGVDSRADIKADTAKLQILEALSNWRPDWDQGNLPPTADTCLPTMGTAPAGSALYARSRGRAVWFPALFCPPNSARSTLACYHNNLTFAALQVEALSQLIRHTAAAFNRGSQRADLTQWHDLMAENAAIALADFHRGDKNKTWRSASAERHIKDACFKELATVLAVYGHPPL